MPLEIWKEKKGGFARAPDKWPYCFAHGGPRVKVVMCGRRSAAAAAAAAYRRDDLLPSEVAAATAASSAPPAASADEASPAGREAAESLRISLAYRNPEG